MKKFMLLVAFFISLSANEYCVKPTLKRNIVTQYEWDMFELKYMEYVHCMDRKKMDEVISAIKDLKGKK